MKRIIYALGLSLLCLTAQGAIDTYEFSDTAKRDRYRILVEELRCPKCQNQNIADSDSPIAMDMRDEIFKKLEEKESDEQIVDYLVDRYGDFVRYKPPVNQRTLVLWYGPAALLAFGFLMVAIIVFRRRDSQQVDAKQALTSEEQSRISDLKKLKQDT